MTCPHPSLRIDGVYRAANNEPPLAAGWTCLLCGTSGLTWWPDADEKMRGEAIRAERRTADRIESEELLAKLRVAGL